MIDWMDVMVQQRHSDALRQEVEMDRLACEALAGQKQSPSRYRRLLGRLGRQLVEWGWQLQRHAQTPQYSR